MSRRNVEPWPPGTRLLHVFGSDHPHDSVVIAGTRDALEQLQQAVAQALDTSRGVTRGVMTRDGEGFWCFVVAATCAEMEEVPFHYQDKAFGGGDAAFPAWVTALCDDAAGDAKAAERAEKTQETN